MKLKAISLFSGAGGCALGFKQAGIDIISSYEIDSNACETYSRNIDRRCVNIDIKNVDPQDIMLDSGLLPGELDIILGGPPCQGFSSAGSKYWSDPRNYLIHKYVEIIKYLLPKWIVFENVEGILTSQNGKHIINLSEALIGLGYDIKLKKIYAHYHGIPQIRKRVFIVGNRVGLDFTWPTEAVSENGLRNYSGFPSVGEVIKNLENSIPDTNISPIYSERISLIKQGETMANLPENLRHASYVERANRRVADGVPTESRGGAPSGIKRLDPNLPAPTITSNSQRELIHYSKDRFLTIDELKRIQTFPDNFTFFGNRASVPKQIGNAIPPVLANLIAKSIILSEERRSPLEKRGLLSFELTKSNGYSPKLKILKRELDNMAESQPYLFTNEVKEDCPAYIKQKVNKLYTFLKIHPNRVLPVKLSDENIKGLIGILCSDLSISSPLDHRESFDLYSTDPKNIREPLYGKENIVNALSQLLIANPETEVYISLLARIYHKRYKYSLILRHQPLPEPIQVYARGILEFYNQPDDIIFLSNFLVWRKWIFDIDNRSAQESGYIFERLLAECLGGIGYTSKASPIKRLNRDGGRQVDCIVESTKTAYEFKMRFTTASSGQGRFSEEKSFASEARAAGYTPVFLVLDPTESDKLSEITKDYEAAAGRCLTGQAAWDEIKRNAPGHLSIFVEKYIEKPIEALTNQRISQVQLENLSITQNGQDIIISVGNRDLVIERQEIEELSLNSDAL